MNAVASHPRDLQQLWRRQNSTPDVQRVDPDAYEISMAIASLERLQTPLADRQQRAAVTIYLEGRIVKAR